MSAVYLNLIQKQIQFYILMKCVFFFFRITYTEEILHKNVNKDIAWNQNEF